jgi:hypothetical protein
MRKCSTTPVRVTASAVMRGPLRLGAATGWTGCGGRKKAARFADSPPTLALLRDPRLRAAHTGR